MSQFGKAKIEVCDPLIGDWQKLADYFDISPAERARFERGQEPHAVWERLRARERFDELADALGHIGREDLVPRPRAPSLGPSQDAAPDAAGLADTAPSRAVDRNRQSRIARGSQPRYALDQRFVRLT